MTSNQFYIPRVAKEISLAVLCGEEHHHLARVARVRAGETVWLFDDAGGRYLAKVERVSRGRTELRILKREESLAPGFRFILAQAVVAAKKLEFILQKAAELGVSDFMPLVTARSLRTPKERSGRKTERWARIVREAVKQSKGTAVTCVHEPTSLQVFLGDRNENLKIFLSEHGGAPFKAFLPVPGTAGAAGPASAVLCVGPEGGWTEEEEGLLTQAGFTAASLGPRVLRTETAALSATAMISHFWIA